MKSLCYGLLAHKKTLRVMKSSSYGLLAHKKTLRVIQSCYRLLVHKDSQSHEIIMLWLIRSYKCSKSKIVSYQCTTGFF